MFQDNKCFSKTRALENSDIFARCYVEELRHDPDPIDPFSKIYRYRYKYFQWDYGYEGYAKRLFICEESLFVHYLFHYQSELLQQLLDDCKLYGYVKRKVRNYLKAVEMQTQKLCKADKEMQEAFKCGNTDAFYALERSNKHEAEQICRTMLYSV